MKPATSTEREGVRLLVRGLGKSYNGREVLKAVDFEVKAGEIFVIMGPSGCGKTVLLKLLIGLEEPDRGEVLIEGRPIQSPDVTTRYRVAMVFQSGALLTSMTVGENVSF
jgi:ABC-type sugar transport system ATPase subunit